MNSWQQMVSSDVPAFVECLEKYPLSMSDETIESPVQHYTLRVNSVDAFYVKVPDLAYIMLDPIGKYDAVVHFLRDPRYRATKKKYLDVAGSFMEWAFGVGELNRISLTVNEGQDQEYRLAEALGFQYEGTCRQARRINGSFIDVHIFGVLKNG